MAGSTCLDYSQVPLSATRMKTRSFLSTYLNTPKVLTSSSKCFRDWRGLAEIGSVPFPPCSCPDPTEYVLSQLIKANSEVSRSYYLSDLVNHLEEMDRFDVLEDLEECFEEDAKLYSYSARTRLDENSVISEVKNNLDGDRHILTLDDVHRAEKGLAPQNYDAFLLYSDDDVGFAREMLEKLENEHNLKLCLKDRDLVGGVTFEHEAIMRLISERCSRLIIIVSPSFLSSPANKFFVSYAQALGIEQRQRKIVPCIYQKVSLPKDLSYYFVLDYTRTSTLWNFWDRLSKSITAPVVNRPALESSSEAMCQLKSIEWTPPDKTRASLVTLPHAGDASPPPSYCQATRKEKSSSALFSRLLPSPPSTGPSPASSGKVKWKRSAWFKKKKKIQVTSD